LYVVLDSIDQIASGVDPVGQKGGSS